MGLLTSLGALLRRWPDAPRVMGLLETLPRPLPPSAHHEATSHQVLVQCVGDPYFLGLFASCVAELSRRHPISTELFVLRSIDAATGVEPKSWLRRSFPYSGWFARQWIGTYRYLMGARVGYRSVSWSDPWGDLCALAQAWSVWRARPDASTLEALQAHGVQIGDLVIDTYLRFRPAPTLKSNDHFLLYVLWQAFRDASRASRYFQRRRPALYLTSFGTYVQHGIAARTALLHGTPVICFGNLQQLGKQLLPDDPFQTKNPLHYREHFLQRPDRDTVIEKARQQLETRLGGGIDAATAYMAKSAYVDDGSDPVPDVAGAVVVFLHDFFDSPHVYADLVFPDFWTWACCTIDTLLLCGRPFVVKPHPNQVAESVSVIERLQARYPTVRFIAPSIPNTRLVISGMKAAVTVYGTVVHELAYLGVPSIACARHPHVAFDFCATADSRLQYVELLGRAHDMSFADPEAMRQQVLEFYAMHNLEGDHDEWAARAALTGYWRSCLDPLSGVDGMESSLHTLTASTGFGRLVDRLESLVLHGKNNTEART